MRLPFFVKISVFFLCNFQDLEGMRLHPLLAVEAIETVISLPEVTRGVIASPITC